MPASVGGEAVALPTSGLRCRLLNDTMRSPSRLGGLHWRHMWQEASSLDEHFSLQVMLLVRELHQRAQSGLFGLSGGLTSTFGRGGGGGRAVALEEQGVGMNR